MGMVATVDKQTVKSMSDTSKKLKKMTEDVNKKVSAVKTQVDSKKGSLGAHVKDLQSLVTDMENAAKKSNKLLATLAGKLSTAAAIRQEHIDSTIMSSK